MNETSLKELSVEVKNLGERILSFDTYVLKRAWGLDYSVWAIAMIMFNFVPSLIAMLPSPFSGLWQLTIVIFSLVGIVAGYYTYRIFLNASKVVRFRDLMSSSETFYARMKRKRIAAWVILFLVAFTTAALISSLTSIRAYYLALVLNDLFVVWLLRASFGKLTAEGAVAVITYGLSSVASFAASLFALNGEVLNFIWIPTIIAWFWVSFYSIYRAPEEMVGHA